MTRLLGAEHVEDLQKEVGKSSKELSDAIGKLSSSVDGFKDSAVGLAKSQEAYQRWLCILTVGLILATAAQAVMVYWVSRQPQQAAVEQIKDKK
jgi:hypothetical protein